MTSCIFIALIVYFGWLIEQVDVVTAFLNVNLDFVIYLELSEGYFPKGKVVKVLKTLYNLKQLVRLWNLDCKNALFAYGFKTLETDVSAYGRDLGTDRMVLITIYINNIQLYSPS